MTWQLRAARPTPYPLPYCAATSACDKKIYIAWYDVCIILAKLKKKGTDQSKLSLIRKINLLKMDISRPALSDHDPGVWNKYHDVAKQHFLELLHQQSPAHPACESWDSEKGRYSRQKTVHTILCRTLINNRCSHLCYEADRILNCTCPQSIFALELQQRKHQYIWLSAALS